MTTYTTTGEALAPLFTTDHFADLDSFDTLPGHVPGGIRCGACRDDDGETVRHATVADVRHCHQVRAWWAIEHAQEVHAEGAWLRAAEAGTPETWAAEERERQIEALGYGPPPGF